MPLNPALRWISATLRDAAWAPVGVFLVHVVAHIAFEAYDRLPWFDIPMHFLGGVAIAYFFHWASINASRNEIIGPYHPLTHAALVVSLVSLAAVIWEFAEFIYDRVFRTRHQVSLEDTLLDMMLGILGGATFLIVRASKHRAGEGPDADRPSS